MLEFLIKIAILVWPFGHLLDIEPFRLNFALSSLDVLVIAIFLLSLPGLLAKRKKIFKDKFFKPMLVFLAIATLSLLTRLPFLGMGQWGKPLLYLARLLLYFAVYFSLRLTSAKKYLDYAKVSLVTFVVLGLVQYIFSPDMSFLKYLGFDDHYYRLIGPLFDPNFTGALLSSLSILLIAKKRTAIGIFLLIPLALTYSRASYFSFLLPFLIFAIAEKRFILLSLTAIPVVAYLLSPKPAGEGVNLLRTYSIFSRFGSWSEGLKLFLKKPLLGWGFNTLVGPNGRVGIDNSYIFTLATTGLAGLTALSNFLYQVYKDIAFPERLAILALLIHALFNNTLFFPWVMAYFVLLLFMSERPLST